MMTSQISSRLTMSSSNTSNGSSSKDSNSHGNTAACGKPSAIASSNSGYSADGSAAATKTAPPCYIDFLERNAGNGDSEKTKDQGTASQTRSNQQKAIELSYATSRAREDLKKAGLPIPAIQTQKSRNLEGNKIDMSKVKLVMAKSVQESPFLTDGSAVMDFRAIPDLSNEYESLFAATYQSYQKNDPGTASTWDSSASSVSSSESEDAVSMPPPALVVPALLEDALKANEAIKSADAKRAGGKRKRPISCELAAAKAAKLRHATMNDALEASTEARVVTLAFRPFIVVHVNTAYSRLTGYSSAKVLGKPLQECLSASCKKSWMKVRVSHPVAALHDQLIPIRTKESKHYPCKCQATLLGSLLEGKDVVDTSSITHYSVSFLPVENSLPAQAQPAGDRPKQIMG